MKKWLSGILGLSLILGTAYAVNSKRIDQPMSIGGAVKVGDVTADADGSAIMDLESTTQGFAGPRMTEAQRDLIGSPIAGLVIYNTDSNQLNVYNGSNWVAVGAGGLGINHIENSDMETGVTGYTAYADAAGTTPVDGTGGSPTATVSQTTTASEVLRGDASLKFAKDAANRQGEGFAVDFTISNADKAQMLTVEFEYSTSANFDYGDFTDPSGDPSDIVVYIYDVDAGALVTPQLQPFTLDGSGKFKAEFQTDSANDDYRLIFHIAGTNASAWDFFIDTVQVGPNNLVRGSPGSDLISFVPTGSWTTNTTYTGKWRRVGDVAEVTYDISYSGAPDAGSLTVNLPSGLVIDTDKLEADFNIPSYQGVHIDSGSTSRECVAEFLSTTSVTLRSYENISGTVVNQTTINNTSPFTIANGDSTEITIRVPISGWSSNVQFSEDFDGRVLAARGYKTSTQTINNGNTDLLNWEAVSFDKNSSIDLTAERFTAKVSGLYQVNLFLLMNFDGGTGSGTFIATMRKNGTNYARLDQRFGTTLDTPAAGSTLVELNSGDYIDFTFQNSIGTNETTFNSADLTYFEVFRLSGPATVAASEKVFAKYRTDTAQAASNGTVIDFEDKVRDTHNAVTVGASWVFTAPKSGDYSVAVTTHTGTVTPGAINQVYTMEIRKNGSNNSRTMSDRSSQSASARGFSSSGATIITLDQGDTVDVIWTENLPAVNLSGTASQNYIVIESD